MFATRAQGVLGDHHVPNPSGVAQALAGGQARFILQAAPASLRPALDDALHSAAVSGVQLAFLVSGIVGLVAGFAVLALVRPSREVPAGEPRPATELAPDAA